MALFSHTHTHKNIMHRCPFKHVYICMLVCICFYLPTSNHYYNKHHCCSDLSIKLMNCISSIPLSFSLSLSHSINVAATVAATTTIIIIIIIILMLVHRLVWPCKSATSTTKQTRLMDAQVGFNLHLPID